MDPQERLRILKASGYLDMINSWAREGCAPLSFRDATGKLHGGSITFVDTGSAVLGVTAGRVADDVILHCDETTSGRGCRVGNAEMSLSRFLARHPAIDLATFQLSHEFVASAGHSPLSVPSWPPRAPADGELMLLGGYEGRLGKEEAGASHAVHVWFAAHAEGVLDRNGMRLRIADPVPASPDGRTPAVDHGGWRGGAVFRVLEGEAVARLELAGIIYEYGDGSELVLAHPLTSIAPDGTFRD